MNVQLRDGTVATLTKAEVAALREIRKSAITGGTLTSTCLDRSLRRTLNNLARRDIVNVGTADEGDGRERCYSINDWRVSDAVSG